MDLEAIINKQIGFHNKGVFDRVQGNQCISHLNYDIPSLVYSVAANFNSINLKKGTAIATYEWRQNPNDDILLYLQEVLLHY